MSNIRLTDTTPTNSVTIQKEKGEDESAGPKTGPVRLKYGNYNRRVSGLPGRGCSTCQQPVHVKILDTYSTQSSLGMRTGNFSNKTLAKEKDLNKQIANKLKTSTWDARGINIEEIEVAQVLEKVNFNIATLTKPKIKLRASVNAGKIMQCLILVWTKSSA